MDFLMSAPQQSFQKGGPPPGYTGPGDIISFVAWSGLRAYSGATTGAPSIDVFGTATQTVFTFVTKADGTLELSAGGAAAFITANTAAGMVVSKWYDQTGNGHHVTASGVASPIFALAALGSSPVVRFTGTHKLSGTGITQAQPWTSTTVFKVTTAGAIETLTGDSTNWGLRLSAVPTLRLNAGVDLDSAALTTGTWYPALGVYNGASSVNRVAATEVTGTAGTNAQTNTHVVDVGNDDFGEAFKGDMVELGFVAIAATPGNRSSLISNQQAFWGI